MRSAANNSNEGRENMRRLARENAASLAELSRLIGRNAAYLQQFVTRGSPRSLEASDRQRLAEFFGVPETALLTGYERDGGDAADTGGAPAHSRWVEIPRIPLEASAGPGALGTEETAHDVFRMSRQWLRDSGLDGADLSAIRVEGDSMHPLLKSGDEIFVDRNRRTGEGVFVVRIGEALHVKQVQARGGGRLALVSVNPSYEPIELAGEDVDVIGRVVWKGGRI